MAVILGGVQSNEAKAWATGLKLRERLERLAAASPKLRSTGPWLIALSGGSDSMAALLLTLDALGGADFVRVAHLDHALRETSAFDAAWVKALCGRLGVPCAVERVDVARVAQARRWNLEDAARRLRYEFLHRTARGFDARGIIVAHTLDDAAETVLLQLTRGTASAVGLQVRRGLVVRPLLDQHRETLREYLRARGERWLEDETNADDRRSRNLIRHVVMPALKRINPQAAEALTRFSAFEGEGRALADALAKRYPPLAPLPSMPRPVARSFITQRIRGAEGTARAIDVARILESAALPGTSRRSLAGNLSASVSRGVLSIFPAAHSATVLPAHPPVPEGLVARTRLPGDRIRLSGGSRNLADVLIDARVPRGQRDTLPVLAAGSLVYWVGTIPAIVALDAPPPLREAAGDPVWAAMRAALGLAREAGRAGETPVGAIIVKGGSIVSSGANACREGGDFTLHAELLALQRAAKTLGSPYLSECTLVSTLEPCLMCLGAALEARVGRIVFGAWNPRGGALGGSLGIIPPNLPPALVVTPGYMGAASEKLIRTFFAGRRAALKP